MNRILFLLSGEQSSIPSAEAEALIRTYDEAARVERPEDRIVIATTSANPEEIEKRVAFSRRVGHLLRDGYPDEGQLASIRRGTYRIRVFCTRPGEVRDREHRREISRLAGIVGGTVSLSTPNTEITVVCGTEGNRYTVITKPGSMRQAWTLRRPRARSFFHPTAIFPKLSRALVNLACTRDGETFCDPFCGTGSLLLEAHEVGALVVGMDVDRRMTRGAMQNCVRYGQEWLGVLRGDARASPIRSVDAIATDVPYGRAASTEGSRTGSLMEKLINDGSEMLAKGKRLVLMHPKDLPIPEHRGYELKEEHHIHVHRTLTRTISVLRRV